MKYLLQHKLALFIVVLALIAQCACELILPNCTSNIVDTGIQQAGVEDAAATAMRGTTFEEIAMMLSEDEEAVFEKAYTKQSDGTYELNDYGYSHRDELNDAVTFPLIAVEYSTDSSEYDLGQILQAYKAGAMSKDDIVSMMSTMEKALKKKMGNSDSLIEQQAIAAAQKEYEALDYDMSSIQMGYLKRMSLIMVLVALGMLLANLVADFFAARTAAKIGRDLRNRLFEKVVSFSQAEVDSFSAASLITRGTNDVQLIQNVSFLFQRMVLYSPIMAIGGIVMVCRTSPSMWWVIVVGVVAIIVVTGVLMGVTMPKFKAMQELIDRLNLVSREILTGLPVIRAFGREAHEESRFEVANKKLMGTQLFTNRAMSFMMPAIMLIMNALSVLIVWVGGHYVDTGSIQTGDLIAFITYAMVVVFSFLMIGMVAMFLPRASVAAERLEEVLGTNSSIADPAQSKQEQLLQGNEGATITFDDVTFRYAPDSADVLEHVSFEVPAGSTCAIIGSTGCGKSTIIKLIERFYDVSSGRVLVDGVDVRDLPQETLRNMLGYSPQQAFLFAGTVESNVAYSDTAMTEERKRMAVEVSQAQEFVDSKAAGMQASISQGGANVSGGQRQRLSIARALAADAKAYLFDDSFSALDYKTDAKLRAEMNRRLSGKTVIIVAQRIATIMNADNIIVLDEGRVAGQGTHSQLLQSCEVYQQIAQSQLSQEELLKGGVR